MDETSGLHLTRSIVEGSVEAWHRFLEEYSTLVYRVAERHLPTAGKDEVDTVYVDILKGLYDGDLSKYDGQSELSTWLFVYAKRKAIDHWRSQNGRFREPAGMRKLGELDREVLQLYYMDRLGLEIVIHILSFNGHIVEASEVVAAIQRIESSVDRRFLGKLDKRARANTSGWSVRYLEYLVDQRVSYEMRVSDNAPDSAVIAREAKETVGKIKAIIAGLPEEERRVIEMRFDQQLQAKEISEKLDLGGARKVYTIIDRVIRKLRTAV